MPETSEEIVKLISKSTDLISYFSTAKEHFKEEIGKLQAELAQLKSTLSSIPQEGWQTPALVNGWVNYGGEYNEIGYFKDSFGIVHLKGLVKSGTANAIFFLPVGYRPAAKELQCILAAQDVVGRIDIMPNGEVIRMVGAAGWISLDGITFRAASPPESSYYPRSGQ